MKILRKKRYGPHQKAHPAVYSDPLLPIFAKALLRHAEGAGVITVLDPFAGIGRIHELMRRLPDGEMFETYGLEIEPGWAACHPRTKCGDVLEIRRHYRRRFDAIVTSPTYGNRFADHHNAVDPESRRSYRHDYEEPLHWNNSGVLHWGPEYREFHEDAWLQVNSVLRSGGLFLLNCKNHIRGGVEQKVCQWHLKTLRALGLERIQTINASTRGMQAGANRDLRCPEYVYVLRKT